MPVFWESERNKPDKIVTLGTFLTSKETLSTHGALNFTKEVREESGADLYNIHSVKSLKSLPEIKQDETSLRWTKQINALNKDRIWARERFFAQIAPLLASEIAVAVVPSHDPFRDDAPIRQLGKMLALEPEKNRIEATGCLVRHTKIQKITFGGPSYRGLHHQSISVQSPELLMGRSVLLLDDIARSGASLRACRELLLEAGATEVQMLALGRLY